MMLLGAGFRPDSRLGGRFSDDVMSLGSLITWYVFRGRCGDDRLIFPISTSVSYSRRLIRTIIITRGETPFFVRGS